MKKYLAALVAAVSLTALTTACGDDSSSEASDTTSMNMGSDTTASTSALPKGVVQADVTFTESMIPHHEQAVTMADHVLANGVDPQVNALANRIKDAQAPEIELMTGWLKTWGQKMPAGSDHGSMDGMMSDSDMKTFNSASGADLDAMFLSMMMKHHQGAIDMATTEIDEGKDADAIALAKSISTSQQAEIEEMRTLLDQLGSA